MPLVSDPTFSEKVGETLYSLRIIPLGGYNKIAGMDPEEPDSDDSFKSKSIPARMLVILAGSLMNFLLPIVLFFSIFMINGIQKPVDQPIWARLWKIRRLRRQACR